MNTTTWRVVVVTEKPGVTVAELTCVEWFRPNPAYNLHADDVPPPAGMPPEFLSAEPGGEGALLDDSGIGRLTLDVTDGPDLHAGDNVRLTVEVIR